MQPPGRRARDRPRERVATVSDLLTVGSSRSKRPTDKEGVVRGYQLGHGMGGPFAPGSVFDLGNIQVGTKVWGIIGWNPGTEPGWDPSTPVYGFMDVNFGTALGLSWWGTFAKSFVKNFSLKSARLPRETLNQCVSRVQNGVFTPKGAKVVAAFSLGSLVPAWGTTSVGTATKAVNLGGNLWTWEKVPAAPILESTPAWASTAIGLPAAVAWGLELGSLAACRP